MEIIEDIFAFVGWLGLMVGCLALCMKAMEKAGRENSGWEKFGVTTAFYISFSGMISLVILAFALLRS